MRAIDVLGGRMHAANTLLCVGLDPDLSKLPLDIRELRLTDEEKVLAFLREVVNATGSHVCAYKVQKAFFDLLPGGHEVLKEVIRYAHQAHPEVSVFVDCKIGDIDNTMKAYIRNIFELLEADGVVVNPYMGDDVMEPLSEITDKAIIVLAKTSNVSGAIMQDVVLSDGRLLWQYVLDLIVNRWNRNGNMIPVVSSTAGINLSATRQLIPDQMPILLAGVGAQGGSYDDLTALLDSRGAGVFVNLSRGVLYPSSAMNWRDAVTHAAVTMKNALNGARRIA